MMPTLQLPPELSHALQENTSEPVRAVDPQTQKEYVLVRADLFERV
jgi:hypothetical protein